jgi:hypothetical protein
MAEKKFYMNFGREKNKQLLEQQTKERKWSQIGHKVRKPHCAIA